MIAIFSIKVWQAKAQLHPLEFMLIIGLPVKAARKLFLFCFLLVFVLSETVVFCVKSQWILTLFHGKRYFMVYVECFVFFFLIASINSALVYKQVVTFYCVPCFKSHLCSITTPNWRQLTDFFDSCYHHNTVPACFALVLFIPTK